MNFEKTTKNTIVLSYIGSKETSELDFEMYDDILGHEDVEEAYDGDNGGVMIIDNSPMYYNDPIKIEEVIKILNDLKDSGSNYVSIGHNCDHHSYTFDSFSLRRATGSDLQKEEEKEKLEAINEANELRKKANKLIEQAQKLTGK